MNDNLSVDEAQKWGAILRDDKKAESQIAIDKHNRRAGKLQWLRQAIGDSLATSLFGEADRDILIKRYGRCVLAWTRSDEMDGVIVED